MSTTALILVDFENEWIFPDSDNFIGDTKELLERTNKVIDFCRERGDRIIFTTHVEKGSQDEFAEGTTRVEIIPELHKQQEDILITKNKISPFYKTSLEEHLKGIEQIVVCGVLTNLCVRSLVEGAFDRDFSIAVLEDCCAAFDPQTHEFTLKDLQETRAEIVIRSAADFLSE